MSLIDITQIDMTRIEERAGLRETAAAPRAAERTDARTRYLLVYHGPEGPTGLYGMGWTLIACHDDLWNWSTALAARGAGAHATARVAKAVAVRVLTEQGVTVQGWSDAEPDAAEPSEVAGDGAVFRAQVPPPRVAADPSAATPTGGTAGHPVAGPLTVRGH